MLLKKSGFIILGICLVSLVLAITIDSPIDGEWFPNRTVELTATSELANSELRFYVSNDTNFNDSKNLICKYENSGEQVYNCNFTACIGEEYLEYLEYHLRFDDPTPLANEVNGKSGISSISGAVHQNNAGLLQGAYYFRTNTADYLNLGDVNDAVLGNDFTVNIWGKLDVPIGTQGSGYKLYWKNDDRPAMVVRASDGAFILYNHNTDGGTHALVSGKFRLNDTKWHMYTATYDHSNRYFNIYVDGNWEAGRIASTLWSPSAIEYIGCEPGIGDRGWSGWIDEFKIFNKSLSHAEISNLYYYEDVKFKWKVNDTGASDEESAVRTFYVDTKPPIINLNSPYIYSPKGYFDINFQDTNLFGNVSFNITLDGVHIDSGDFNQTHDYYNQTSLSDGIHNYSILSTDLAGNYLQRNGTFNVVTIQNENVYNGNKTIKEMVYNGFKTIKVKFFGGI